MMDNQKSKAINVSITTICDSHMNELPKLFKLFEQERQYFDGINLSTLLHKLSKLLPEKISDLHEQKKYFIEEVVRQVYLRGEKSEKNALRTFALRYQFGFSSIANILRALSLWGISPKISPYQEAIHCLVEDIPNQVNQFNSRDIATVCNALAKLSISAKETPYLEAIHCLTKVVPKKITEFNEQEISILLNALQKLGISFDNSSYKKAVNSLVKAIPGKIADFNPQNISNSLNALAKWGFSPEKSPYKKVILCLVQAISKKIDEFNGQNLVNSLLTLSKWDISPEISPHNETLLGLVIAIPRQTMLNPQDLANSLTALLKWDISCRVTPYEKAAETALFYLIKTISDKINTLNALDIYHVLSDLLKVHPLFKNTAYEAVVLRLLEAIPNKIHSFSPQNLALIFNALPSLDISLQGAAYKKTILCLLQAVPQTTPRFNPQDIANVCHALPKLDSLFEKQPHKKAYEDAILCLLKAIPQQITVFNPQDISNVLNALTKLDISFEKEAYKKTILCLAKIIPQQIKTFNAQNLANSLHAFSKWDISPKVFPYKQALLCLVNAIPDKIKEFNSQNLANSLHALSKWNISPEESPYKEAILCLVEAIPRKIKEFNSQNIANLFNALSKWNISPEVSPYKQALLGLVTAIPGKIKEFHSQSIANTFNALSKWNIPIEKEPYKTSIKCLLESIEKTKVTPFAICETTSIALALCLFKFVAPNSRLFKNNAALITLLFRHTEKNWVEQSNYLAARQFYQINLYQPGVIPNPFIKHIERFTSEFKDEKNLITTNLQKSVAEQARLGHFFKETLEEEYFIAFTHVDIAWPQHKVILAVNGPSHYDGETLNHSSRFNNHLLEKLGWTVVSIPYFEWQNPSNKDKEVQYLREKLALALPKLQTLDEPIKKNQPHRATTVNVDTLTIPNKAKKETLTQKNVNAYNRKKTQKKALKISPAQIWQRLIEQKPNLGQVRSDELQEAYLVFASVYQSIFLKGIIEEKKEQDLFTAVAIEKLAQAIYLKKIELFSRKTMSAFFQCKPCFFGVRLNPESHPKIAFTENTLTHTFQKKHQRF